MRCPTKPLRCCSCRTKAAKYFWAQFLPPQEPVVQTSSLTITLEEILLKTRGLAYKICTRILYLGMACDQGHPP